MLPVNISANLRCAHILRVTGFTSNHVQITCLGLDCHIRRWRGWWWRFRRERLPSHWPLFKTVCDLFHTMIRLVQRPFQYKFQKGSWRGFRDVHLKRFHSLVIVKMQKLPHRTPWTEVQLFSNLRHLAQSCTQGFYRLPNTAWYFNLRFSTPQRCAPSFLRCAA